MKRYSAAEARARFADVLDAAEAGSSVVIERKGVRFLIAREAPAVAATPHPLFEILDPAIERGQWTWVPGPKGWRFTPRPARRRKR